MKFRKRSNVPVEQMLVREVHTYSSIKQWSLSKAAVAIVALGVMLATQGTAGQLAASLSEMAGLAGAGAAIATGAATAGMVSAAQTAAISLIQNDMDVGKVLGDVRKLAGSRGFVATVVEGGLLPGHNAATLGGAVGNEIDRALLRKAITNEDIRPESIASGAAANYIQAAGSTAISGLKASGQINATEQVLLHGAVHGVGGAVRGIPDGSDAMIRSAALSASAAMAAETLANVLIDPSKRAGEILAKNPDISKDELVHEVRKSLEPMRNAIQLIVAAGGLLAGDERAVSLMAYSAGTALDYNSLGDELKAAVEKALRSRAAQLFKEKTDKALEAGKKLAKEAGDWMEAHPGAVEMAMGTMAAVAEANASNGGRRGGGLSKGWRTKDAKGVALKQASAPAKAPLPKPEDRPLISEYYSTAVQVRLKEGVHYPGTTRSQHFQEANKQLYYKIQSDPIFAKQIETLYPGITKAVSPGPRGGFLDESPTKLGLTWHHNARQNGVMELIPFKHHTGKGPVQANLHPGGKGGHHYWGGNKK